MKNLKRVLILPLLLLFTIGYSQKKEIKPLENALLWEVTGKDIKKPSYIFGTIHIIDAKDFFMPKGLMSALDVSNKIMFEIDMKDMNDMSKMMGMMNKIFMKDGKSLKDIVSQEDYKLINDHFQKLGIPMFMFERMKPMFLTIFASGDMNPQSLKDGSMKSYEFELMSLAESSKKETGGLESIDFQIGIFDEIPYEAQAEMLLKSIKTDTKEGEDQFAIMTEMYKKQDINAMVKMIQSEDSEVKDYEHKLLTQRNENWISIIIENAKSSPTLFAVGAGHLAGVNGVITLLRSAGYTVKPLSN